MSSRDTTELIWLVLGLGCAALGAVSLARRGVVATAPAALQRLIARPPLRALVALGWMWLGWHVFAR